MFRISSTPLVSASFDEPEAGGWVTFEGKVRRWSHGREVLALEYEAYEPLAVHEGNSLLEEATRRFDLVAAEAVHRIGKLEVGETAIIIRVAGRHRGEAFRACEFLIDALKLQVPIWKKECFTDGDSEWVHGSVPGDGTAEQSIYTRQTVIPEIGCDGQARLKAASVLVIGAGGLGAAAIPYLAASGVGKIGIVDGDKLEACDLQSQPIYGFDQIGRVKADIAASYVRKLNPFVDSIAYSMSIQSMFAERLLDEYDIVLDCTNNLECMLLINDICVGQSKHLVTAKVNLAEGFVMSISPEGPCLRCLAQGRRDTGDFSGHEEQGVSGVATGVVGLYQVQEVIQIILKGKGNFAREVLLIDINTDFTKRQQRESTNDCQCCLNARSTSTMKT